MNRRRLWLAAGGVLIAIVALIDVTTVGPRITVRWREGTAPSARQALERQYDLRNGEPIEEQVPHTLEAIVGAEWKRQAAPRDADVGPVSWRPARRRRRLEGGSTLAGATC